MLKFNLDSKSNKFYKQYPFWFGVVGVISLSLSLLNFLYKPKTNLEFKIEKFSNLLDIRDDGIELKVVFKDSIEMLAENKNISIYEIEINNKGNKDIRINDFDSNINFGIELDNGEILKRVELISSSDFNYFSDIVDQVYSNKILVKKKIIDAENYFAIKFYVLHNSEETPNINALGKISGQKNISVLDTSKSNNLDNLERENKALDEKVNLVFISLILLC